MFWVPTALMANNGQPKEQSSSGKPRDQKPSSEDKKPVEKSDKTDNDKPSTADGGEKPKTKQKRPYWGKNKNSNKSESTDKGPKNDPEIRYSGRGRGSRPVRRVQSHNIEFSAFPALVRETYQNMVKIDHTVMDSYPFPIFQHYCNTFLQSYLIDYAAKALYHGIFSAGAPALEQIHATDYKIPTVVYDYIASIGNSVTPSDDVIRVNLSDTILPNGRLSIGKPIQYIDSGSFGLLTHETHNAYECYVSPLVTKRYILEAFNANQEDVLIPEWNPLPHLLMPAGGLASFGNFLGYFPIERISDSGCAELRKCLFENATTVKGRLAYSENVMEISGLVMNQMSEHVNMSQCDFKFRETSSMFIVKRPVTEVLPHDTIISDVSADLQAPFAFGSSTGNRAHYYGFKRYRDERNLGCCVTFNGLVPQNYVAHRNDNYLMQGTFAPMNQMIDYPTLRDNTHFESSSDGIISQELSSWLLRLMIKK